MNSFSGHCCGRPRGTWRTYDGTNGLPGPAVCLAQDRRGHLWIGTWGFGACRYDGEVFRVFGRDRGLRGRSVWAIVEDSHGRLWMGTDEGLNCFDGEHFAHFTTQEGLAPGEVNALCQDGEGRLWVGTEGGLSYAEGERGQVPLADSTFTPSSMGEPASPSLRPGRPAALADLRFTEFSQDAPQQAEGRNG